MVEKDNRAPDAGPVQLPGNEMLAEILIVDDSPQNIDILHAILTREGYRIRTVEDGDSALKAVAATPPDIILLDVQMPGMDGFTVCQRLQADTDTRAIPVIFISALDAAEEKRRGFSVGGLDYITRPFQAVEVLARIRHHLRLNAALAEVQQLNTDLESRVAERTRALATEVTERKRIQEALEEANRRLSQEIADRRRTQMRLMETLLHDGLTQLPNRAMFMQRLTQSLQRIKQDPGRNFAVMVLDCDRFKLVNDAFGHPLGDQLLIAIARRLTQNLGDEITLARLGGDEFAILLDNNPSLNQARTLAVHLQKLLGQEPFRLYGNRLHVSVSIGILMGSPDYQQPEHLLRDADTAMYQAKAMGRNAYRLFDAAMHNSILQRLQLETDLQRALEQHQFLVYYQPIVDLQSGRISGFEALARWQHPERGLITPDRFIPVAEETGLIVPLGIWLLREACRQTRDWQTRYSALNGLDINVNLSIRQFIQPDLLAQIDAALADTGLASQCLKLEITESVVMDNDETATRVLDALQARHIRLGFDDFGTGYSSLSYLHRFPIDILKIDRSFIGRIGEQGENLEIIQAIMVLAGTLGMRTVAEGVETPGQLRALRGLHCDCGQGYLFARPLAANDAQALLAQDPCW